MFRTFRAGGLVLLGLMAPRLAPAQVLGIPVHNSGITSGVGIAGEVGFANQDYGKGTAFGATGIIGIKVIGFTASVSTFNPKAAGNSTTSYGGTANLKVFGGPLVPLSVTLQGGWGHSKNGNVKLDHIPVGLGIAINIPNPALAIKPWIAPRLDVSRVSGTGVSTTTDNHFGLSAGIDFNLLGGLGFRAAYDRVFVSGLNPSLFGIGAHYVFKVPGL